MPPLPPQDLGCPDPDRCPVPGALPDIRVTTVPAGSGLYRVYQARWGYDEFNPGFGDARLSPIDHPRGGGRVPSMYLAGTPTAALLETVFREVHQVSGRVVYERDLRGALLAHVSVPDPLTVADLRDPQLARLELRRDQLVTTSAEHHPCTRRVAVALLRALDTTTGPLHGILWHSRQAELAELPAAETLVVCGHRYPTSRGHWPLTGPGARNLYEGPGRLLIDEIAESLGAVVDIER